MTHRTATPLDVTVEEIEESTIDPEQYQLVAYPTPLGIVVVAEEWPSIEADE